MRIFAVLFTLLADLSCLGAYAQQPAVIAVVLPGPGQTTTWVRAIAGANEDPDHTVCTMTVNRNGGPSNMHLECYVGSGAAARRVYYGDLSVTLAGLSLSFGGPANRVSILLARGLATISDQWQITANDQFKTGVF